MAFYLCPIASGSSGNCTFLEAGDKRFLIDVGISGKKAIEGLQEIGVAPQTIDGILVTHEHTDHIQGIGIFSRKFDTPIYATSKTWDAMLLQGKIGKIKEANQKYIVPNEKLTIAELGIHPYTISHDAADPVGYYFEHQEKKIAMATDMGKVDRNILNQLKDCDGLLLEFNHDINMVEVSSYPYALKRRILGDYGHLSNELAAKILLHVYGERLKWVILGHLSKENNTPDLAYLTAKTLLEENNIRLNHDIQITVAGRNTVTLPHHV
jgi:phosphoribosyl 1,2-cyclic phosphodiesterase